MHKSVNENTYQDITVEVRASNNDEAIDKAVEVAKSYFNLASEDLTVDLATAEPTIWTEGSFKVTVIIKPKDQKNDYSLIKAHG